MPKLNANADTRQVARNAAFNYLTVVAQLVSGIVVTPLLFRGLGASAFGTYALLVNIVGYAGLLELGVGTATMRLVAERSGGGEPVADVLGSSRRLYVPISMCTAVAMIPVIVFAPMLPGASGASATEVRIALSALVMVQILALLLNVYPALIFGRGRADLVYGLGAVFSVLTSVVQGLVAVTGGGIALLAGLTAAVGVVNLLLVASVAKRMHGEGARRHKASGNTTRHLLSFGLKNAGVGFLAIISTQSDLLIVGALLPARAVAAYAVSSRVANFAKNLATRASDILVPTFADAAARGDTARQRTLFVEACVLGAVVLWPLALSVSLFASDLLQVWLGEVPAQAPPVLVILLLAMSVQVWGHNGFVFFNGRGDLSLFLRAGAVLAVVNLIVSVSLTLTIGLIGPAVATLGVALVFDIVLVPRAVARALDVPTWTVFQPVFRVIAGPLAAAAALGSALSLGPLHTPLQGLLGAACTTAIFYALLPLFLGRDRRTRYRRLIRRASHPPGDDKPAP